MLTCQEMTLLLADYLDGTMPAGDRKALDHHVGACPPCQAFLKTYAATIRLTGMMPCDEIPEELKIRLAALPRREIARASLEANGALVQTRDLEEALAVANRLAPEHLELQVADPFRWLSRVTNAGAIFLGRDTPEVVGDYVAGPNHVLPTAGTARFASGLGVEDFVKRSSLIHYSRRGLREAWPHLSTLASVEGLQAHGEAARLRLSGKGSRHEPSGSRDSA